MAAAEDPDMIMLDVRMPKMTGYEACEKIKEDSKFDNTPIVFLSAKGQDAEIQKGLAVGAVAYILKPFVPDGLVNQVKDILAKSQA